MERPALKQLLADITARKVDVIVVYKVDRLSRSLHDFARMVEIFDKHGVSFVSVTQQFNTTSSMGRLTLNVLLSFAQFEREVTGERIRDKIAASKKKGIWMGGPLPLGYDVVDRKLIVNQSEAKTVDIIYRRYLELGCVRRLQEEMIKLNVRGKKNTRTDGSFMARGAIYKLLSNPIYIGQGMPLSPMLSNFFLREFDKAAYKKMGENIIRYADDIIVFATSQKECEEYERFIRTELDKIRQKIPSLGKAGDSKTNILAPSESVDFLGVEIYPVDGKYGKKNKEKGA